MPDEAPVMIEGEIRNNRDGYGYAVEFVDVPPETRARLEQAVERLRAKLPRANEV